MSCTSVGGAGAATSSARGAPAPANSRGPGPLPLDPAIPLPAGHREWIERTLTSMSLRERVGQMVMVWVLGDYTNAREPGFLKIVEQVERDGIGGLVMSLGSPIEVAAKVNYLQSRARVPLLVSSDVEPNLGRLEGGVFAPSLSSGGTATVLPSNMAMGAGDSEADAEAAGRIVGVESRAIGIHMAFAPVVDVNNNPSNPVINVRSFGENAAQVARLSAAFIRGVQSAGVAATPKHFPGHGDTDVDSHLGLPVINVPRARLDSVELVPFRASVRAGAAGMMTAHIALPNAYGDSTPATLSQAVMQGLLRDTLAFRGVTVTDAMTMQGLARGYPGDAGVLQAVEAGDDILLMPPDVRRAIDAVVSAVEAGRVSRERIDRSVRRILELKLRTGAVQRPIVSLDALRDSVATPAHWETAYGIASRAITLLRDSATLVPMSRSANVALFTYAPDAELVAGTFFTAEARALAPRTRAIRLSPRSSLAELDSLARDATRADYIVVYSYTRTLEGEGRLAIPASIAGFVNTLAASGKLVVVAGGNPYQLRQIPAVPTYAVTYGRGEALERAAARALFGASAITGKSPVTLPGFFARGQGVAVPMGRTPVPVRGAASPVPGPAGAPQAVASPTAGVFPAPVLRVDAGTRQVLVDSMRSVLERAVADGAFPGAYAAIGTVDGIVAEFGAGRLDVADATRPDARTVWDIASLTKVIGTTSAVMKLVEAGRVRLDEPVRSYLPAWTAPGTAGITVRHLLSHSGGLPSWRPFYKEATSPAEANRQLFAVSPDTVPGVRYVYSDIGFILLGKLVERVSGMPLARFDSARVFAPAGMRNTRYLPPSSWRARTAPTEDDPWRQRKLRGEVHDENAAAFGGVSGHAGLFSTGEDLSRFARMYLRGGSLDGKRVLDTATISSFTGISNPAVSRRALGWETPTGSNSSGTRMSPQAFGHTGFTGTSIWMDPSRGIFVILLTNRVNPTRENRKIGGVRVALADALLGVLDASGTPGASRR
ncbi:MAG TPA: glycoside hydrolase family 3 N-terminal domain-containing protein [Gemmatimonas sp.]|nr:glycoside hydrolase family 3 N-terminal domain-containing protein [Gemmatimonas sp.]